jgi:N-acetylglucosamine kinase-like BadF-type ATPase
VSQADEQHVVIGVDGGGTSTDVLVADLHCAVLGSATGGGSNWESVGLPAMAAEVARTVDEVLTAAGRTRDHVVAAA